MKDHNNAFWLLTGIRPIEINKVPIDKLHALAPQRYAWAWQDGWQDRLHMRIFRPLGSG